MDKLPFNPARDCAHVQSYYSIYPVPVAAALWCGIKPERVNALLQVAEQKGRGIYRHPEVPCLEPRCRAIHEAIQAGELPVCRETGSEIDGSREHVAPERRHVRRQTLKDWIARTFPLSERPAFLFDEIERKTHHAINADAFAALQADRDAKAAELEQAMTWAVQTMAELEVLRKRCAELEAKLTRAAAPGARTEGSYLNIIGALVQLMLSTSPGGQRLSVFQSQADIIAALEARHPGTQGLSKRNLEAVLAEAKRNLPG